MQSRRDNRRQQRNSQPPLHTSYSRDHQTSSSTAATKRGEDRNIATRVWGNSGWDSESWDTNNEEWIGWGDSSQSVATTTQPLSASQPQENATLVNADNSRSAKAN